MRVPAHISLCVCVSACTQCPLMSSWNSTKLLHTLFILHRSRMVFIISNVFFRGFPCLQFIIFPWLCVRLEHFLRLGSPSLDLVYLCVYSAFVPCHHSPSATAHKMIEKCFEHSAYLCVHRQAQAVNKLNMQIILFSPSVSNKVYLSKNPIMPDNYYPKSSLEVSVLTDHCSRHGNLSLLTRTHTLACILLCCLNRQASCRVSPNILLMQCK